MACWVPGSNGSVPPQAFVGGEDNDSEAIFVARAYFNGAIVPGKAKKKLNQKLKH